MTYKVKQIGAKEHLAAMGIKTEIITFEKAMAALTQMGNAGTGTLWPTLSGNEIYAFANAVCYQLLKEKP